MHCLVFTDTDLYSLTKGKSYLAEQKWRRPTCLQDQCYDVGCHPWSLSLWLAVIKLIYIVSDSYYIFLFVFTLNVYLDSSIQVDAQFEVNENFMLSWVEIVFLLLNKALSLKRRGTHLGLHYQNAYSWVPVYIYC